MSKPKQARVDSFFSLKTRDRVPEPLGQKITPDTSTAPISNCTNFLNQSYESKKIAENEIGQLLQNRSTIPDADRCRLPTSDGPKSVTILNTVRQERRRFHKTWLDDVRFCNWFVYTQISGGGGLCKICVLMQACLKHGTLENAAFVKRHCTDFKKFFEKAVAHRDINHFKGYCEPDEPHASRRGKP